MAHHVAILTAAPQIDRILGGQTSIEIRLTQDRIAPYGVINKHDIIFLKESGGFILGEVEVDNVLFFDNLNGETVGKLRREYGQELAQSDSFWLKPARFATVIFLTKPKRYVTPMPFRKHDRRPWILL
ncbi:MAG: hypothetical protein WAP74_01215 [Patescibacteria group bacterium]